VGQYSVGKTTFIRYILEKDYIYKYVYVYVDISNYLNLYMDSYMYIYIYIHINIYRWVNIQWVKPLLSDTFWGGIFPAKESDPNPPLIGEV
jgi:GTPase SAR1 family protein